MHNRVEARVPILQATAFDLHWAMNKARESGDVRLMVRWQRASAVAYALAREAYRNYANPSAFHIVEPGGWDETTGEPDPWVRTLTIAAEEHS